MLGLFAFLVGAAALGVGLWAACVWLDWRTLVRVQAVAQLRTAPAECARLARYARSRATSMGVAQALALVTGIALAAGGLVWPAVSVWAVTAGGIACTWALLRLRPPP